MPQAATARGARTRYGRTWTEIPRFMVFEGTEVGVGCDPFRVRSGSGASTRANTPADTTTSRKGWRRGRKCRRTLHHARPPRRSERDRSRTTLTRHTGQPGCDRKFRRRRGRADGASEAPRDGGVRPVPVRGAAPRRMRRVRESRRLRAPRTPIGGSVPAWRAVAIPPPAGRAERRDRADRGADRRRSSRSHGTAERSASIRSPCVSRPRFAAAPNAVPGGGPPSEAPPRDARRARTRCYPQPAAGRQCRGLGGSRPHRSPRENGRSGPGAFCFG